ncbi:hypothetical protein [Alkalitalea saponilacus]|uniref:Uncharacterized protein n=1 Tax=Alkalitalea saponilacus TaxID=889453 RepID=A0A1T5GEG0_9BACT|nr:hypothetical protein [Alkalitalea saponilacus]ASB47942.1 hypothetical protein CDL62_01635 [Alkalitalea saponilacus]SKC06667.1 hypothetical protein SAMN03080601_01830 [Alkalitalea saponilacus]
MRKTLILLFLSFSICSFHLTGEEKNTNKEQQGQLLREKGEYVIEDSIIIEFSSASNWSVVNKNGRSNIFQRENGSYFKLVPACLKTTLESLLTDSTGYADSIYKLLSSIEFGETLNFRMFSPVTTYEKDTFYLSGHLIINNIAFKIDGILYTEKDKSHFTELVNSFSLNYKP